MHELQLQLEASQERNKAPLDVDIRMPMKRSMSVIGIGIFTSSGAILHEHVCAYGGARSTHAYMKGAQSKNRNSPIYTVLLEV